MTAPLDHETMAVVEDVVLLPKTSLTIYDLHDGITENDIWIFFSLIGPVSKVCLGKHTCTVKFFFPEDGKLILVQSFLSKSIAIL